MTSGNDNKELILAHEREFAARLASQIIPKPKLNAWMIFIPFIFIFYFQDLSKYKKQRKEFIDNYLLSREKALNEAHDALAGSRKPDTASLAKQADLKERETRKYGQFLAVLADHYSSLLPVQADTYPDLIKKGYGNKKENYLLFIHQLNTVEKELNKALKASMKKSGQGIGETIRKMENSSDMLRRMEIEEFYA
ncbi:NF038143 family protein [Desulfospira joergensenii]|uniref:NF038143 family protein n=1 Tax=Desulfospira joergensenii TaxID=53329 RepID=UPI0003B7A4C8|nr:NF038143 family protein [Desulfospira joergensenii]